MRSQCFSASQTRLRSVARLALRWSVSADWVRESGVSLWVSRTSSISEMILPLNIRQLRNSLSSLMLGHAPLRQHQFMMGSTRQSAACFPQPRLPAPSYGSSRVGDEPALHCLVPAEPGQFSWKQVACHWYDRAGATKKNGIALIKRSPGNFREIRWFRCLVDAGRGMPTDERKPRIPGASAGTRSPLECRQPPIATHRKHA